MDAVKYEEDRRRKVKAESGKKYWPCSVQRAIDEVEQWAKDHPRKTYRDDFFEKFPNALENANGYPFFSRQSVYGLYATGTRENDWDKEIE